MRELEVMKADLKTVWLNLIPHEGKQLLPPSVDFNYVYDSVMIKLQYRTNYFVLTWPERRLSTHHAIICPLLQKNFADRF